jgi:methyl-accepting chemotaxis protein
MTTMALNRLKLWQKLGVLILAMSVPALLAGFFYLRSVSHELDQARDELAGSRYLAALGSIESALLSHEGRAFALASGDAASRGEALSAQGEVSQAFERASAIDAELGPRFGVSDDFKALESEWSSLAAAPLQQNAEQGAIAHAQLIEHLAELSAAVAAVSTIASDPDHTTHGLLEISSRDVPAALSDASNMRRYAVNAASKGYLGGDDRMGIEIARARVQSDLDAIRAALAGLPPGTRAQLAPAVHDVASQFAGFYAAVSSQLLNAANLKVSGGAMYETGAPTAAALRKLLEASGAAGSSALAARMSSLRLQRDLNLVFVLLAIGLIHALTWTMEKSLTRPLKQAVAVFERIAGGRYDSEIDTHRTDEAGQVLQALAAMQQKLHGQIENERTVAAENSRIRHALDKASTCVVLADAQHRIIYLNDAAQATFEQHAAEIRGSLPAFDASRLRGSGLEMLSADAAAERRALDALTGERVEERTLGGLCFRTVTNRVLGESGERLGTVMEWTQRTQEVRVEEELQGMLAAVNGGDLTRRIDLSRKSGFFEALGAGVNRLTECLVEIVSRVKDAGRKSPSAPMRSPPATRICRCAPRSRPPRSRRPPPPWRR